VRRAEASLQSTTVIVPVTHATRQHPWRWPDLRGSGPTPCALTQLVSIRSHTVAARLVFTAPPLTLRVTTPILEVFLHTNCRLMSLMTSDSTLHGLSFTFGAPLICLTIIWLASHEIHPRYPRIRSSLIASTPSCRHRHLSARRHHATHTFRPHGFSPSRRVTPQ
jgi:hypothetical protein